MARDWLEVVQGEARGQRLDVEGEVAIGRSAEGPGNLAGDPELSRTHARFRTTASGDILVEDLGSTNGTFVNGKKIDAPYVLKVGDQVEVGTSVLEVKGQAAATRLREAPAPPDPAATAVRPAPAPPPEPEPPRPDATTIRTSPLPPAAVPPPPAAAAAPPPAAAQQPPTFGAPPPGGGPPPGRRRGDPRVPILAVLLLLAIGAAVFAFVTRDDDSSASSSSSDGAYDGTVYVLSDRLTPNGNSVLAYRYKGASLTPLRVREYPTGGTGAFDSGQTSSLDGDQQVWVNQDKTLLFAVNQGSDSIAVFHINDDGTLEKVKGSPFPSGGKAPVSVGVSGDTLIVVNKALDGVRDLKTEKPTITQLKIHDDGTLTPIGTPVVSTPGANDTQAYVTPNGKLAFVSEFVKGDYLSFVKGSSGFNQGPPTMITNAQRKLGIPPMLPPGGGGGGGGGGNANAQAGGAPPPFTGQLPPGLPAGAQGIAGHPTQPVIYSGVSILSELLVHTYDASGQLTFVKGIPIKNGFLICWADVSPNGKFLYTGMTSGNRIAVFDLADPRNPRLIQNIKMNGEGNTLNLHVDPSGKALFVINARIAGVPAGEGNELHAFKIGPDGRVSESPGSPTKVPVTGKTQPYGLVVVKKRYLRVST